MKIAFYHRPSPFLDTLSRELERALTGHDYLSWHIGEPAPAGDIELLLAMGTLEREQFADQRKLTFIQTVSAGYEGIDVAAATELGIWVSSAPSGATGNAVSVAEWTVFLMLGASRRLPEAIASLHDRAIVSHTINGALEGKTACIVGLGSIGRSLADRLRAFGMHVTGVDEKPQSAPDGVRAWPVSGLNIAVAQADYVIVAAPATKENEHLIDADVLAAMKPSAILVNIARGSLVDENALIDALRNGRLAAAGLDVLATEPADQANPLLAMPQVLVTPHMAGATDLMLAGTVGFVDRTLAEIASGKKPQSVLNDPPHPRLALQAADEALAR